MKDKTLREVLFGSSIKMERPKTRGQIIEFPAANEDDKYRIYKYSKDNGFILCLIKKIEKLEDKILSLENIKKK